MGNQGVVKRFKGSRAFQELLRQMETRVGQRPRIRIRSKYLHEKSLPDKGVVVHNHVLKDMGKPSEHSVFQVADLDKSKSGQPLPIRFVWPPEHADPHGKDLFALEAIEVLAS